MKILTSVLFPAVLLAGCATTTGNHRALGVTYPPRAADCPVAIFRTAAPTRRFTAIAHLNVHLEKTFFIPSDFAAAEKELRRQACQSGADGIIDIRERKSSYVETRIYNLSATGIRFDGDAVKGS